jgi:hypothetical protein
VNRPAGRYDEPRATTSAALKVLAVLVAVGVAVATYVLYDRYQSGRLHAQVRGYEVVSDRAVRVTFEVSGVKGVRGECRVRARDHSGAETGSALVPVGPSTSRTAVVTYTLTTKARAATGEVPGCRRL